MSLDQSNTDDMFDWFWQPAHQLSPTLAIKTTATVIAIDKIKTQDLKVCAKVKQQHQDNLMKMMHILAKLKH